MKKSFDLGGNSGNHHSRGRRFTPGDVLRDRYRIVHFIGQGGMGEVYEVEDQKRGEMVALKTVLPKLLGSAKVIARFRREIELSRRISHPNVLRIFDVFELRSRVGEAESRVASAPCMIMEFLAGKTLADRLQEDGRMPAEQARPLVCQMAAALAAAHRAGVVHRDLKPDNIFLVPTGNGIRVVLTDFGVARPNKPNGDDTTFTATDVIVGTPTYMAPEQLELEEAMPVSDIYTLGLVIYEMITGTFPFKGDTAIQVVFKRIQEDAPSPRQVVPDLDDTWDQLILRCLERDPKQRLAHAEDIVGILEGDRQAMPCLSEIGCPGELTPPAKRSSRSWWPFRS
ncbi:MAG: serine/threonine protein kinase [bacterium]|nr:serine/threonine protein kinase [bacterium]